MPSFVSNSTFSTYFSSYFSKKDKKYDISLLVISFITFCALSAFCWFIIAVNFTGWFFITVIGGFITKCRQELIKSLIGTKKSEPDEKNMLDHSLSSRHHINHFEDFRLSSSKERKDSLPSIPSHRSSSSTSNKSSSSNNNNISNFDSILSLDFSFPGLTGGNNNHNSNSNSNSNNKPNKFKKIPVLAPSDYSTKRNEKRMKNIKQRHVPDIPSRLGPNRQESSVNYYPSERHSHRPKSKLSVTEKMIESTAAYRVGRKCNGWINCDSEEYAIRQKDSKTDCANSVSYDDPFCSREPIKELNVRLDQERPQITKQERRTYNKSPAISLQYARQYLTILLSVKKQMNL